MRERERVCACRELPSIREFHPVVVCVCERERVSERERECGELRIREFHPVVIVCVYVKERVSERAREREGERVCVCLS